MQQQVDVLVVDDRDMEARDTILGIRYAHANSTITRLKDGEAARDFMFRQGLFKDRPSILPRLVILELDLPRIHGLELLKQLRLSQEMHEIPVVIFTRNSNPIAIEEVYAAGASVYLVKPAERGEYLAEAARLATRWLA
jgi:CheY-like chemotaxis protein